MPENTRVLLEELPGDKSIIAGERGLVHMCCFDAKENLDTSGCANLRISLVHEMHSDEVLVGKYEGHEDGLYTFSFFARVRPPVPSCPLLSLPLPVPSL